MASLKVTAQRGPCLASIVTGMLSLGHFRPRFPYTLAKTGWKAHTPLRRAYHDSSHARQTTFLNCDSVLALKHNRGTLKPISEVFLESLRDLATNSSEVT